MKNYCLYHSPCADGMSAAYAVWKLWGNDMTYIPMSYGQALPPMEKGNIVFADFTVRRAVLTDLASQHFRILVLDHHATAEEDLKDIELECPNIHVVFDKTRSGAMIAWEHIHGPNDVPSFIRYVQDYDLWKFELPGSKAVNEAIYGFDQNFESWEQLAETPITTLREQGDVILTYLGKHIRTICEEPRAVMIREHMVPAVNASYFLRNDCCHYLLAQYPEAPFVAAYEDCADGNRHWSLRSQDERESVQLVAQEYGGGGHRNAAGFRTRANSDYPSFSHWPYKEAISNRRSWVQVVKLQEAV